MLQHDSGSEEDVLNYERDEEIRRRHRHDRSSRPRFRQFPEKAEDTDASAPYPSRPEKDRRRRRSGSPPFENDRAFSRHYEDEATDSESETDIYDYYQDTDTARRRSRPRKKFYRDDSPQEGHSRSYTRPPTRHRSSSAHRDTCSCHCHDHCDSRHHGKVYSDSQRHHSRTRSLEAKTQRGSMQNKHQTTFSTDETFSNKVRILFKIIKATHHLNNASILDPPAAILNTTSSLTACVNPAFATPEISEELKFNALEWQDKTMTTLRRHYQNCITQEIHILASLPDPSWEGPFEVALTWARRNLGRKLKPKTIREAKHLIQYDMDKIFHTTRDNPMDSEFSFPATTGGAGTSQEEDSNNTHLQREKRTLLPLNPRLAHNKEVSIPPHTETQNTEEGPQLDTQDHPPLLKDRSGSTAFLSAILPRESTRGDVDKGKSKPYKEKRQRFQKFKSTVTETQTPSASTDSRSPTPISSQVNLEPASAPPDPSKTR